jgi:hypothetical protein
MNSNFRKSFINVFGCRARRERNLVEMMSMQNYSMHHNNAAAHNRVMAANNHQQEYARDRVPVSNNNGRPAARKAEIAATYA